MKIQAKTKDKPTPVEVDYDFADGKGIQGLVEKFGNEVVEAHARGALVISLQAFMRRHIDKGSSPEAIQAEVSNWKPDVRNVVKVSALEKATNQLDKLSSEDRKELLKKLRELEKAAA